MIPKVIHYCWFGGKPKPKSVLRCIKSWRKFCPGYQIVEWNESNFDINCCKFVQDAYKNKAWSFVSDYARLKIVYENGGFYLDTDVELLKSLDGLLHDKCFFGRQQNGNEVATGLGFGAQAKHRAIKQLMDQYKKVVFDKNKLYQIACPVIATKVFDDKNNQISIQQRTSIEKRDDFKIYSAKYFDPIANGDSKNLLCQSSYSIHHATASWTSKPHQFKRALSNFIGQETINIIKQPKNRIKDALRDKNTLLTSLYYYLVLGAVFFPRGLNNTYPAYKILFSSVSWIAAILIYVQAICMIVQTIHRKRHLAITKKDLFKIFGYFVVLTLITLLLNKEDSTGLQQLFAYPAFMLFTLHTAFVNPKKLLNTTINVSLVALIMNLALTHVFFAAGHTTFLGHVQVFAQLGSLSIFAAILYHMLYKDKQTRSFIACLLALFTMLSVDAISANLTAIFLTMVFITLKYLKLKPFQKSSKRYTLIGIITSLIVIIISTTLNYSFRILDFSGRGVVWRSTISSIKESPIYGYGIDGINIKVFWNERTNMTDKLTYTHNQVLQNLLDGGVVALILFWMMFITCIQSVERIKQARYKCVFNTFIIISLAISIFESPSLYCYIYIFLALCYSLPRTINKLNAKRIA